MGGAVRPDFTLYDAGPTMNMATPPMPTGANLGIKAGQFTDSSTGGTVWIPTGWTEGQDFKAQPATSDLYAWLKITFDSTSGLVSALDFSTGATVPVSTSTTFYISLGNFTVDATTFKITIGAGGPVGIGSQIGQFCSNGGGGGSYVVGPV